MAQIIPLQTVPNQEFTIFLDGNNWNIRIVATNGCMSIDIAINGETILEGFRVVAGTPVIPFVALMNGNLVFLTQNDDLPDWTQFNISQFLYYYSIAELEAVGI